jgi:hypothetical protein
MIAHMNINPKPHRYPPRAYPIAKPIMEPIMAPSIDIMNSQMISPKKHRSKPTIKISNQTHVGMLLMLTSAVSMP